MTLPTMRTDTMALPEDINTYIALGGGLATTVIAYMTGKGYTVAN